MMRVLTRLAEHQQPWKKLGRLFDSTLRDATLDPTPPVPRDIDGTDSSLSQSPIVAHPTFRHVVLIAPAWCDAALMATTAFLNNG